MTSTRFLVPLGMKRVQCGRCCRRIDHGGDGARGHSDRRFGRALAGATSVRTAEGRSSPHTDSMPAKQSREPTHMGARGDPSHRVARRGHFSAAGGAVQLTLGWRRAQEALRRRERRAPSMRADRPGSRQGSRSRWVSYVRQPGERIETENTASEVPTTSIACAPSTSVKPRSTIARGTFPPKNTT